MEKCVKTDLKFPFPSSSLTSNETVKVKMSLSGERGNAESRMSVAAFDERLKAVEKL